MFKKIIIYISVLVFFISNMVLRIFSLCACPPLMEEAFSLRLLNKLSDLLNPNSSNKPTDFNSSTT